MKILLVDDDKILLDNLQKLLENKFSVSKATTGFDAVKLHSNDKYDVLIIDFDFGDGINGIETSSIIREQDKEIKIIIFSAYDIGTLGKQSIRSLGATFLEKPIDNNKLMNSIKG
jgi:two-component system competent response regulator ComA